MRKFRGIIQSKLEPQDKEILWYYKDKLLYYNNGVWEPFVTAGPDAIEFGETKGTAYEGNKGKALSDKISDIESTLENLPKEDAVVKIDDFSPSDTYVTATVTYSNGDKQDLHIGVADETSAGLMGVEDTKKIRNLDKYVTDVTLVQGQEFDNKLVLIKQTNEENDILTIPTVNSSCNGLMSVSDKTKLDNIDSYVENIDFDETTTDEGYKFTVTTKNPSNGTTTDKTLNVGIATNNSPGLMTPEEKIWINNIGPSCKRFGIYTTGDLKALEKAEEEVISVHPTLRNVTLINYFVDVNGYAQENYMEIPSATLTLAGVMSRDDKVKLENLFSAYDIVTTSELSNSNGLLSMFKNTTNKSVFESGHQWSQKDLKEISSVYSDIESEVGSDMLGRVKLTFKDSDGGLTNEIYYLYIPAKEQIKFDDNDYIELAPDSLFINAGGYIMRLVVDNGDIYDKPLYPTVSTTEDGLMTAADKTKLDSIDTTEILTKSNITNDLGTGEELVMSQKGVTDALNNLEDTIEETIETSIDGVGSVLPFSGIIEDSITVKLASSTNEIGSVLFSVDQGAFVYKVGDDYFSNWKTSAHGEALDYNSHVANNNEGGLTKTDRFFEYNDVLYYSDGLGLYPISVNLVQGTGQSTSKAMSQKAVTDALNDLENRLGTTQILTQSEYDNLTTKSDNVIYFIKG